MSTAVAPLMARPGRILRAALGALALVSAARAVHAAPLAEPAAPSRATTRPTTRIDVRLDAASGQLDGLVELALENTTGAALERVYVWLLPNRLARPPAALDDVNHYWIYPHRFTPGSMELVSVRAGAIELPRPSWRAEPHAVAGRGVLWSIALPTTVAPGAEARLAIRYTARIPARYGTLGCIDGQCTLVGGFYPMLAALDASGWDLGGPPMRTDMEVTVTLARPGAVVLFDQVAGQVAGQGAGQVERASARARGVAYATLLVAPRLHESAREVDGVPIRYLSPEPPPPADDAHDRILPYTQENHARLALDTAAEVAELMAALRVPGMQRPLLMVEAPLRFELASAHPGVVLISDRFYRIFPATRFRKLHQRQLVRALIAHVAGALIADRGSERDRDLDMAADMVASYLTDLFVLRQYRKSEFMGEILAPVSFIPVVDQLLYAPQTMFADAYFGNVLEGEPLRDHPGRFMHERPRGRLFYEKLRDLLSPEALILAMRAVIAEGADVRAAAEAAHGAPLGWFFRQWSRPYPRVNYRLAGTSSRPLGGGLLEHTITVERRIATGDTPPVEPVIVAVTLDDGDTRRLRWDGRGEHGVLRFQSRARIDRVVVDPDGRLVEQRVPGQTVHPRFDNRDRHRLRFVYNSFSVVLNVTDLSALLGADFTLGRVHDVKNRARVSLYTSAAVAFGATARYTRSFGPEITPDRLLSSLSTRLSAQRLRAGFSGEEGREASRLSLGLSLGASNRIFEFEPRFSHSAGVSASLSATRRDALDEVAADWLLSSILAAGMTRVHTLAGTHTLALDLDAALALGDIAERSQLLATGGMDGLRGHAPGALFSRARVMARGEYRHVFVHDLAWNLGHYSFVRGVGGALYADVAALSPCESYDLWSSRRLHATAGYGLQIFYDSFGTLPQLMRLDVAVPLLGRDHDCLGAAIAASPPVMIYLGFLPPF